MTEKKKRPVQLSGKLDFGVRKRGTLDAKGFTIDVALVAETKSGRQVALVMDQGTFKKLVIDITAAMYEMEFGRPLEKSRIEIAH